jgi:hypothetical protein
MNDVRALVDKHAGNCIAEGGEIAVDGSDDLKV